jgi:hypothetical protein
MAWMTLDQLRDALAIPASAGMTDEQLSHLLVGGQTAIETWTNRKFEVATYTEYHTGNNTPRLVLKQTPVRGVTSLWYNANGYYDTNPLPQGDFGDTSLLTEGVDWTLDRDSPGGHSRSGLIYRIGSIWPLIHYYRFPTRLSPTQGPAWGNIKVVYQAGYDPIPGDLLYALTSLIGLMARDNRLGGPIRSERAGRYGYEILAMPASARGMELNSVATILSSYREIW